MGFTIDMDKEPENELQPGIYLGEITKYTEEHTRGGDPVLVVYMKHVETGRFMPIDRIMLDGPGWGIGKSKLGALGAPKEGKIDVEKLRLMGKRVWVALAHREYQGKTYLNVDVRAQGSHCGYWPEDETPALATKGGDDYDPFADPEPIDPGETPF